MLKWIIKINQYKICGASGPIKPCQKVSSKVSCGDTVPWRRGYVARGTLFQVTLRTLGWANISIFNSIYQQDRPPPPQPPLFVGHHKLLCGPGPHNPVRFPNPLPYLHIKRKQRNRRKNTQKIFSLIYRLLHVHIHSLKIAAAGSRNIFLCINRKSFPCGVKQNSFTLSTKWEDGGFHVHCKSIAIFGKVLLASYFSRSSALTPAGRRY